MSNKMGEAPEEGTQHGVERFTFFTDAVVAIAITLLVLPLVDIVSPDGAKDQSVADILGDNLSVIYSFLLSFLVIGRLWLAHHRIFEIIGRYNTWLIRLGFLWLLTIVILPFPTELLANHGGERLAMLLYIGDIALSSACISLMIVVVQRDPSLLRPGAHFDPSAVLGQRLTTYACFVALGISMIFPQIGYFSMLSLVLVGTVKRFWLAYSGTGSVA